jgi:hypothetical protein
MTRHFVQPEITAPPANAERFLLDEPDISARVWEDSTGLWHSCIDWGPAAHYTDFSESPHRTIAIRDVLETYRNNYRAGSD